MEAVSELHRLRRTPQCLRKRMHVPKMEAGSVSVPPKIGACSKNRSRFRPKTEEDPGTDNV
eukprot:197471-Rhodomonas_salina.3